MKRTNEKLEQADISVFAVVVHIPQCGFQSGYFVFNMTENGVQTYAGVAIDLLNELSFRLNFR